MSLSNPSWDRPGDARHAPRPQSPTQLDVAGMDGEFGAHGLSLALPPANAQTWAKTTSGSKQTVTFAGGGTTQAYPALTQLYSSQDGTWSDGVVCWLVGANGETLANATRYGPLTAAGFDGSGVAIYSEDVPSSSSTLTVETTDGTTTVLSAISPPLIKVGPGLNLQGSGGALGHATLDLCGAYQYGTMAGVWSAYPGSSNVAVPVGSGGFGFGSSLQAIFGNDGSGNTTWATAGAYLASFHTQVSFSVTGGTVTGYRSSLSFAGNYPSGPPNDTAGAAAEAWGDFMPSGTNSTNLFVSVMGFVHITTPGTLVNIFGSITPTGTGPFAYTANTANPYSLWAMRVG